MIIAKYELMKELQTEIKDNLFDMDSILDLMEMEEYQDSKELEDAYNNLYKETERLKDKYYEVCEELDLMDEILEEIGA